MNLEFQGATCPNSSSSAECLVTSLQNSRHSDIICLGWKDCWLNNKFVQIKYLVNNWGKMFVYVNNKKLVKKLFAVEEKNCTTPDFRKVNETSSAARLVPGSTVQVWSSQTLARFLMLVQINFCSDHQPLTLELWPCYIEIYESLQW